MRNYLYWYTVMYILYNYNGFRHKRFCFSYFKQHGSDQNEHKAERTWLNGFKRYVHVSQRLHGDCSASGGGGARRRHSASDGTNCAASCQNALLLQ